MEIGDYVKSKSDDVYGVVEYSTFGFSVHFWDKENNILGKTLGQPEKEVLKYWEVVKQLPDGYGFNEYGLPVNMNLN